MTRLLCLAAVILGVGLVVALTLLLGLSSIEVIRFERLGLIFNSDWHFRVRSFGAASMILGTFVVSIIALILATPIALGSAIAISELLPRRLRFPIKAFVELLAGIPSVVYGLLGIAILREFIAESFSPFGASSGDNLLSAGILLAIMILPTILTQSEDALRRVGKSYRHQARALGLNRTESILFAVLPQAAPGIAAGILLGFGRAFGETIAVFLIVGRADNQRFWGEGLSFLFEPGQTLSSKLGGAEVNIAYGDPLHWSALMSLALILMLGSLLATTLARSLILRRRTGDKAYVQ